MQPRNMIGRLSAMAGFCIFTVLVVSLAGSSLAQTTVRPYKFGFTIDEQQHRREMRDERGIVMGEFGFITADGIYHVTVYATDEEGRFRILAMRNYPYKSPPKTIEMVVVAKKKPPPPATTAAPSPKSSLPKYNFQTEGCAGCFLTKTQSKPDEETNAIAPKQPNPIKTDIRTLSKKLEKNAPSNSIPGAKGAAKAFSGTANANQLVVAKKALTKTLSELNRAVDEPKKNQISNKVASDINTVKQTNENILSTLKTTSEIQRTTTTQGSAPATVTQDANTTPPKNTESYRKSKATQFTNTVTPSGITSTDSASTKQPSKAETEEEVGVSERPAQETELTATPSQAKSTRNNKTNQQISRSTNKIDSGLVRDRKVPLTASTNAAKPNLLTTTNQPGSNSKILAKPTARQPGAKAFINTKQSPAKAQTTGLVRAPTLTQAKKPSPQPPRTITPNGPLPPIDVRGAFGDGAVRPQAGARNPSVPVGGLTGGGTRTTGTNPAKNYNQGSTSGSNGLAGVGGAGDLYHFKYTLDFNGHEETGSRNGNKVGSYFAIGDDNIQRTIEYVANENGYQPRIQWRRLDAQEADLLRALQANTLKDYEFVWFKEQ